MLKSVSTSGVYSVGRYHRKTFNARLILADAYALGNHPNFKKGYYQAIVEDSMREFGPNDLLTRGARFMSAYQQMQRGNRQAAIQEIESLYKLAKDDNLPMDDPNFMFGLVLLADTYRTENRRKECIEVEEEVLAYWESNGLAADPETRQTRHLLGWDYLRSGDGEKALATFRKNVPASIPPYEVMTSEAIYSALMKLERYEEALAEIQNSLELLSKRIGKDKRTFAWGRIKARIGHALVKLKRYDEAEGHLVEGYHQMVTFKKDQPSYDANEIPDARMGVCVSSPGPSWREKNQAIR